MGRIDKLAERYGSYIALTWQRDLADAQRTIFIVYDKSDERRLRARTDLVELATKKAGHRWLECDRYFESPEDLELKLEEDVAEHVAGRVRGVLQTKYS